MDSVTQYLEAEMEELRSVLAEPFTLFVIFGVLDGLLTAIVMLLIGPEIEANVNLVEFALFLMRLGLSEPDSYLMVASLKVIAAFLVALIIEYSPVDLSRFVTAVCLVGVGVLLQNLVSLVLVILG